jgi:hypothetical protein
MLMSKINFNRVFAAGFRGISKLIIEFPVEQKEFIKGLRFSLARTARALYPDISIAKIAHITGLLRNQVDDALCDDSPVPVLNKEALILQELYQNRDQDNHIAISGEISFNSIATKHLKGKYSLTSVIETLIHSGVVKRQDNHLLILSDTFIEKELYDDSPIPILDRESVILGELYNNRNKDNQLPIYGNVSYNTIATKYLKNEHSLAHLLKSLIESGCVKKQGNNLLILTNTFTFNSDENYVVNQMAICIDRLIDTIIHNKNAKISQDIFYQSTTKSTKIPPTSRAKLHKELHKHSKKVMLEYKEIIDKYEKDVPNGYYPTCGISIFEFDGK